MSQTPINKPVQITAVGFRENRPAYPRRMEYEGKSYSFIDAGLSCVVKRGSQFVSIFTMTDGSQQFRLRSDTKGSVWTLMSMSAC